MPTRRAAASFVRAFGVIALAGVGVWSCYDPSYVSGVTKCSSSGACPNNWVCQSGVCHDEATKGSGGGTATGGTGGTAATGGHGGGGTGGTVATGGHGGGGTGGTVATGGHGGGGTGGAVATGGHGGTGTGGTVATGGAPGTGGTALTCLQGASARPASSLITDFSDATADPAHTGEFLFGSTVGDLGGTSRYASGTIGTLSLSAGALTYATTVEAPTASQMFPFNGFALYFDGTACIDASAYTGVSFSLSVTGTCQLVFAFNDSEHLMPGSDALRGACTAATCFPSQFLVSSSTTGIAFAGTPDNAGQPTAVVDPKKLTSIQWQFNLPNGSSTGCSGTMTLDNVRFY